MYLYIYVYIHWGIWLVKQGASPLAAICFAQSCLADRPCYFSNASTQKEEKEIEFARATWV